MFLQFLTAISVDLRAAALAALVVAVALLPHVAVAAQPPHPGARCYGNSLPLQSNLPLGTSSADTDVVDIHAIQDPAESRVAAWYYLNRRGDRFIQVATNEEKFVAKLFSDSNAKTTAASVLGNKPWGFIRVVRGDAIAFEHIASSNHVMQSCFSHPLDSH
jgi:hypothetical protein